MTLVESGGRRWLVGPYGEVGWVRNVRAAGRVTLSRGRRSETLTATPLGPADSAVVLRQYLREVPITRPYFDVRPDSPREAFVAEAPRHPVFLPRRGHALTAAKTGVDSPRHEKEEAGQEDCREEGKGEEASGEEGAGPGQGGQGRRPSAREGGRRGAGPIRLSPSRESAGRPSATL